MSTNGSAPAATVAPSAPSAPAAAPAAPAIRPTVSNFQHAMELKNVAQPTIAPTPPAPLPKFDSTPAEPEPLLGEPPPEPAPEPAPGETPETIMTPEPELGDVEFLAKAREWQANDYLPEEFLGKLIEVEIKLDDGSKRMELVTAKEMKDGYLRQSALSRAQTRIHHERQQMQQRDANVRALFERIQSPEAFLQEFEDRGYGETLEKVALNIAQRRVDERSLINAAGIAVMQQYGCDQNDRRVHDAMRRAEAEIATRRANAAELRRIQAERDQLAQQTKQNGQQADVSAMAATMRKQLDQLRPIAFKAHRIHDNASTQKEFARHLLAQLEVAGNYEITRDAVMTAARTLSEELADARAADAALQAPRGTPPSAARGKPLSPTSAVAGRAVANGATRTRKRPSDLMGDLYGKT